MRSSLKYFGYTIMRENYYSGSKNNNAPIPPDSPTTHLSRIHPQSEFTRQAQVRVLNLTLLAGLQQHWIMPLELIHSDAPIERKIKKGCYLVYITAVVFRLFCASFKTAESLTPDYSHYI